MKRILFIAISCLLLGMSAKAQNTHQQGCQLWPITATASYTLVYQAQPGEIVNVQAGYFTAGSPASVSTAISGGYVNQTVSNPFDLGTAATNTTSADLGSQAGAYPFWYIHATTLSSGGTLNFMVCVSPVSKSVPLSSVGSNILIKGGGAGTASSITDNGTTVSSSESLTFAGGTVPNSTKFHIMSPDPGSAVYTGINTNGTALDSTHLFCTEAFLPYNKTITGIAILNGTTVTADNHLVALYPKAGGAALANSALTGAVSAGPSVFQQYDFTATYAAVGPADYFACVQSNGNTDTLRMAITGTGGDNLLTKSQAASTFGTLPSLTAPTGFVTAVGPYIFLY